MLILIKHYYLTIIWHVSIIYMTKKENGLVYDVVVCMRMKTEKEKDDSDVLVLEQQVTRHTPKFLLSSW